MNTLFASEKDYGNLTEITLKKGLNEKQAREVAIGLEDELTELFNHWLKTHDEIFETRAFRYFGLSKNSNLFYSKFLDRLDSIIRRKKIMVKSRNI